MCIRVRLTQEFCQRTKRFHRLASPSMGTKVDRAPLAIRRAISACMVLELRTWMTSAAAAGLSPGEVVVLAEEHAAPPSIARGCMLRQHVRSQLAGFVQRLRASRKVADAMRRGCGRSLGLGSPGGDGRGRPQILDALLEYPHKVPPLHHLLGVCRDGLQLQGATGELLRCRRHSLTLSS